MSIFIFANEPTSALILSNMPAVLGHQEQGH